MRAGRAHPRERPRVRGPPPPHFRQEVRPLERHLAGRHPQAAADAATAGSVDPRLFRTDAGDNCAVASPP